MNPASGIITCPACGNEHGANAVHRCKVSHDHAKLVAELEADLHTIKTVAFVESIPSATLVEQTIQALRALVAENERLGIEKAIIEGQRLGANAVISTLEAQIASLKARAANATVPEAQKVVDIACRLVSFDTYVIPGIDRKEAVEHATKELYEAVEIYKGVTSVPAQNAINATGEKK